MRVEVGVTIVVVFVNTKNPGGGDFRKRPKL